MEPLPTSRGSELSWRCDRSCDVAVTTIECQGRRVGSIEHPSDSSHRCLSRDQAWDVDWRDGTFAPARDPEGRWHRPVGTIETALRERTCVLTFPDFTRFHWRRSSFWRSRMGFGDEDSVLLVDVEFWRFWAANGTIRIHGGGTARVYLPALVFFCVLQCLEFRGVLASHRRRPSWRQPGDESVSSP